MILHLDQDVLQLPPAGVHVLLRHGSKGGRDDGKLVHSVLHHSSHLFNLNMNIDAVKKTVPTTRRLRGSKVFEVSITSACIL